MKTTELREPLTTLEEATPPAGERGNGRKQSLGNFDFMTVPLFKRALRSRWFQPVLLIFSLVIFVILIMAGLVGSPVGNRNAAIIIVWIFWFFILIVALVPIGGRSWCMMCPLPAPGEWLSRLSIVRKSRISMPNPGLKWPKRLDNLWVQNFGFLVVSALSPVILTRPWATSYFLIFMIVAAVVFSLLFKKQGKSGRIFCRYVCPLGGFIGLYSLAGALEIKARDRDICRTCRSKSCVKGSEDGYGCPWFEYPGKMDRNLYCGLCTECIKTCPNDNIAFRTRPFGADLLKKRKLDEAFKSFIMLGSAMFFLMVFFGWWGTLKDIADPLSGGTFFARERFQWNDLLLYSGLLWSVCLLGLPGLTLLFAWITKKTSLKTASVKKLFIDYAYALVPLGLMAWVGFVVGMLLVNGTYVAAIISDPFGWGWNLFGTRDIPWRPLLPRLVPFIQIAAVFCGLTLTAITGKKVVAENAAETPGTLKLKSLLPFAILTGALGAVFIFLFVMP